MIIYNHIIKIIMGNKKVLFSEKGDWGGNDYELELHLLHDHCNLSSIQQVQAVCFLNEKEIVFYENIEGWFGNPGGTVEKNELVEETLKRELIEVAQVKLVDWKTIGVEKIFHPNKLASKKESCFLRVVAKVELIDKPVKDPDGKAVGRIIVNVDDAIERLGWGEKGKQLIELALDKYNELEN